MNVLVTGGAGYIGSSLVNSLLGAGHTVRVIDRKLPKSVQKSCEYVQINLLAAEALSIALDDIEAVYHLAWSFHPEDYRREIEENLLGTLNLLEASKASRVRQLIFASTATVYGPTGKNPVNESDLCQPEKCKIGGPFYAITKLACEHYTIAFQGNGSSATIVRIHGVFSKDRLAQFARMIGQAIDGKELTVVANAGGQYAHLDDVIWAMCEVLGREDAHGETFNLGGGQMYCDLEIAEYILEKVGSDSKIVSLNDPSQSMISVSTDKLTQVIGYHPRDDDFLREMIDRRFQGNP
jgi:UDP-glucose 4-epimerase